MAIGKRAGAVVGGAVQVALPSLGPGEPCNICGDTRFEPGPAGRLGRLGAPPRCVSCRSLERHRQVRRVYSRLDATWLGKLEVLQLSPDVGVDQRWFRRYELSQYHGDNHLDLEAIDRPDQSYDLVICNHVLEHVADDRRGYRELMRITRSSGFVQVSVPSPHTLEHTVDWGYPRAESNDHYRGYGRDLVERFGAAYPAARMIEVEASDPVTAQVGYVYLATTGASCFEGLLTALGE